LAQRQFRVLPPPSLNLPWRETGTPTSYWTSEPDTEAGYPHEAIMLAGRIIAASERCTQLESWIASFGNELADLGYLFSMPTADVRELAAAYVAYPPQAVRSITEFMLAKTDLAPHPMKGWEPIVAPLSMMFRNFRGSLSFQLESSKDIAGWLQSNAQSGGLGSYLSEIRIETSVAWQAGLLHLTTSLPIERLLQRRFSEKTS
jgi:hypothetical protein